MTGMAALIVAGGSGARLGGTPKQFRGLQGRPVVQWSVDAFRDAGAGPIVIAVQESERARVEALFEDADIIIAPAGPTRSATSRAGLEALARLPSPPDTVLIHDAARPFVSADLIAAVHAALDDEPAACPVLPVRDALKRFDDDALGADVDRAQVRAVQTPQGFRFEDILAAFRSAPPDADWPDDIAVAKSAGLTVASVPGDHANTKLTFAEDWARAATPRVARMAVGHGVDVHRLKDGEGLTLCGVFIDAPLALVGHSDADVGLHALTDAILGAACLGDIGDHFPPSDPQWAGADSAVFLAHAGALAGQDGAVVSHVDVTLVCEAPKIKPHRAAMRARIAAILGLEISRVSVKATTTERLGFTGRGEGVAAHATATLVWE